MEKIKELEAKIAQLELELQRTRCIGCQRSLVGVDFNGRVNPCQLCGGWLCPRCPQINGPRYQLKCINHPEHCPFCSKKTESKIKCIFCNSAICDNCSDKILAKKCKCGQTYTVCNVKDEMHHIGIACDCGAFIF